MTELRLRLRCWIERPDGAFALSGWRVGLLEAVAETGSISAAAERVGLSYRRAWGKIREMEEGLGVRLVETRVGGSQGGGAELTPVARDYMARYRAFEHSLIHAADAAFAAAFGPSDARDSSPRSE
jgi:molybdate transport system regulatory protein